MTYLLIVALLGFFVPTPSVPENNAQWLAFNRAGAPASSSLQCFTPGNVAVSDGRLVITTKAQIVTCSSFDMAPASHDYTSGFVSMRDFHFLYGSVEVRAKFGGGNKTGAWPVIWMADASCQRSDPSGTNDDCNEQEIDIAEILKSDVTHINQQIHVDRFRHNDGCTATASDTSQNFHVYRLDWSPGVLIYKVDGIATCTIRQRYVPNAPMYLKINMFVGGFGGDVKNGSLPWMTVIDYVKISQGSNVVFSDDFHQSGTIQPAEFVVMPSAPGSRSLPAAIAMVWSNGPRKLVILCLALVAATVSYRVLSRTATREKP